jgi:hypothetical protein
MGHHDSCGPTTPVSYAVTETEFLPAGLSSGELDPHYLLCGFIQMNGRRFRHLPFCRLGGQSAVRQ